MNDPQLLAYLLDEGPAPEETELANFIEEPLPPGLAERTLNAVALERTRFNAAPQQKWHRKIGFVGLSLAAAALLVTSMPSDSPVSGNLENMTAKGLEQSAPKIHLKLARIEEGQATRHRTDRPYSVGEALVFRVQSDSEGWVTLLNIQGDQIQPILQAPLGIGENDLAMENGDIARWEFDTTDRSGFFAVISSETSLQEAGIAEQLISSLSNQPLQPQPLCLAAQSLGWQCDAIEVMVTE